MFLSGAMQHEHRNSQTLDYYTIAFHVDFTIVSKQF